ncbi:PX domain-containing protein kinase-like protein isoform X1 [Leucoraja erinacea]|uniref:PX domain-containing protein kinase-like protein isoform X1 n=1 Tax=Leucoraja erinaceus TaxID=7782 RepID=UPI002453B2BD|nr:PX domain-containing protein kinase-like protein isoform X1 [Leucoraja erinacea]
MALMEKRSPGKVLLDDTVPLRCVIEASQNLQSHTEYIIRVQRGVSAENSWQIIRRYSDFDILNSNLQISGLILPLPPKKLIGNMDREFIAERQRGLQNYLNFIITQHVLSSCELVKKFLDPTNYSSNYTEIALQQVSMFFRSEPNWEVVEPLKEMGWRFRKRYLLIKSKDQPKERQVLSWADLGPDMFLCDKDLQSAMKLLPSWSHPYIYPVTFATASESSGLVIRMYNDKGTLRDYICKAKPKDCFMKKYCSPKKSQGLDLQQIKLFGRQILEVLKFLHEKRIPYGHLHSSNVMIDGDACKLLDIENSFLGLPSYYRPYYTQSRKINTTEAIDVYCFGHVLYEMTYGKPPDSVPVDSFPSASSSHIVSVLQSILSAEAWKTSMPTIAQLLETPLFVDVMLNAEKPQFKIPSKLKEALKAAKECMEKRLTEEQKAIHRHKRLARAQSHHGSEEEKKKRKILARKKSKQSLTENEVDDSAKINHSNNANSGSGASSPLTSPSSPTPPSTAVSSVPAAPALPPSHKLEVPLPSESTPLANGTGRGALLSSIQSFKKGHLKPATTRDHNMPTIK